MASYSLEINLEEEHRSAFIGLLRRYIDETKWPKNTPAKSLKNILKTVRLEGDEIHGSMLDDNQITKTQITLPLFDSFTMLRCSCTQEKMFLEDKPCHHQFALASTLLKKLLDKGTQHDFFEVIESLNQVDSAPNSHLSSIEKTQSGIEWVIHRNFAVDAHYMGKLSFEKLKQEQFNIACDRDWQFLALMMAKGELMISTIAELDAFSKTKQKETLGIAPEIIESVFEIHTLQDEEFIHTILRFQGKEINEHFLTSQDGIAAYLDHVIVYQKTNPRQAQFLKSVLVNKPRIPIADKERLVRHLMAIENQIPISADKSLAKSSELEPDSSTRLRFSTISEKGWLIEVLVQPGKGSSFVPGLGPEMIFDLRTAEPSLVKRNFEEEVDQAMRIIKATHLNQLSGNNARFYTESHDRILEAIQVASRLNVPLEWPRSGTIPKVIDQTDDTKISLSISDKNLWFEAQGTVEIGSQVISLKEFISHLRKERRYVELPNGAWAKISEELKKRAERLQELLSEDLSSLTAAGSLELIQEKSLFEIRLASERFLRLKQQSNSPIDLSLPNGLTAELRPYQKSGFEWLQSLSQRGFGGCLADDMGLGKTLQTIAVLLKNKEFGPSLVIAPVSLLYNWAHEIKKFAPELNCQIWNGQQRHLGNVYQQTIHITLLSYGTAVRDCELLKGFHWNTIVIDEAQNIKNPATLNWKTVSSLPARWKIALSGTPVENKLEELWAILSATCPGILGSRDEFKKRYEWPIVKNGSEKARDRLKTAIKPFVLRRLKKDYLTELPPKTEINLWAVPDDAEKNFYEACRLEALDRIKSEMNKEPDGANIRFTVLASLQTLRQVSCHPILLNPEWPSPSAKENLFLSTIEELRENGHKVLVFSQFTKFLTRMKNASESLGIKCFYLDGTTPIEERRELVEKFQSGIADAFFISLKAGGTGLNLTRADYVIHLDPWWNPAVEAQASDRAWRMGQSKPVTVYRIITQGSIEEKILELHAEKKFLSDDITSGANGDLEKLLSILDFKQKVDFKQKESKDTVLNLEKSPIF